MKIALLGGSFNPVHNGHLSLAENVIMELGYDKVVFVPAYISPFKQTHTMLDKAVRLRMLQLAIADNPSFEVDDFELKSEGVSYTIDTVRYFYKHYDVSGKPGLIIGADLLPAFSMWKNAEALSGLVELIVGRRPEKLVVADGVKRHSTPEKTAQYNAPIPPYIRLQNETLQISSSYIRSAIREHKAWRYLVPESVYREIIKNGLYK